MSLSGILKTIVLVAASTILFGDPVSIVQCVGLSIALLGLLAYQNLPANT